MTDINNLNRGRSPAMFLPTVVMGLLAAVLFVIAYDKGGGQHMKGLRYAADTILQILPLLIFAFMVAGLVQALIPQALISEWVGQKSGWRGILIGTAAGGLSPGGPFVSLPIAAGLIRSGASVGTTVAYLTGWSLWAFARLPMEVGILGWKLTLIRVASTFFFPPLAGLVAQAFFSGVR
jgi:uncharacterized membrane protein YraQ (UPF0718 family)